MTKKIAILGRGTAGMLALTHFHRWAKNCEIELYYDPAIAPQAVGEGSTLDFPRALYENIGFRHADLPHVDGSFKGGIWKTGWSDGLEYMHSFPPPGVGYHFNAVKLQSYIKDRLKDQIKIIEHSTTAEQVDADFVMDCSGKPASYEDFVLTESIPVNSVHVTPCYWDHARFQHTLTLARPYGWVFGIPLQNRCSIGYLYNNTINTLEEVKEDVKEVFSEYGLTPSTDYNTFSFKNYYRKQNFSDRVAYNGNASFFLEPLEATSISLMDTILRMASDNWAGVVSTDQVNQDYINSVQEIETMIMLHYFAGSKFNTPFWEFAQERGSKIITRAKQNPKFNEYVNDSKQDMNILLKIGGNFGTWGKQSFKQNLENLNLYEKIDRL
jgi:tryptophan halogenase